MTKEEAKASIVLGGIYTSPYSGINFKVLPGFSIRTDDSVQGVAKETAPGVWQEDGFQPYYWYNNKPAIRVDTQQAMEFEQKQLPIFN